jgi:hypothetical protein
MVYHLIGESLRVMHGKKCESRESNDLKEAHNSPPRDVALPMELLFLQLTVEKRRNPYNQRNI